VCVTFFPVATHLHDSPQVLILTTVVQVKVSYHLALVHCKCSLIHILITPEQEKWWHELQERVTQGLQPLQIQNVICWCTCQSLQKTVRLDCAAKTGSNLSISVHQHEQRWLWTVTIISSVEVRQCDALVELFEGTCKEEPKKTLKNISAISWYPGKWSYKW